MVVLFSKERITALYGDEESYGQYCETVDFDRVIPDGIYNLGTQDGMYLSYHTNEDGSTSLLLSENPEECMAEIVYRLGKYHIRFTETYRCLYSELDGGRWNLTALDSICSEKEEWLLIPDGSGFRIINGYEYALAHYDDGTITLVDPLTADESSIVWFIQ